LINRTGGNKKVPGGYFGAHDAGAKRKTLTAGCGGSLVVLTVNPLAARSALEVCEPCGLLSARSSRTDEIDIRACGRTAEPIRSRRISRGAIAEGCATGEARNL
jgi:hypothetical protein